jgi:hypothetical protein
MRLIILAGLLALAATAALAGPEVFEMDLAEVAGDGWTGLRFTLAPNVLYPWSGLAWWRVYFGDAPLNPDDPGGRCSYLLRSEPGNRYFTLPRPVVEAGPWHVVVQAFDGQGELIARTDDMTWPAGAPEPGPHVYAVPTLSVGYGFQCGLQIINPSLAPCPLQLELLDLAGGTMLSEQFVLGPGEGLSTFLDELVAGPFNGWARITAAGPLLVTGLTAVNFDSGWAMLPGRDF